MGENQCLDNSTCTHLTRFIYIGLLFREHLQQAEEQIDELRLEVSKKHDDITLKNEIIEKLNSDLQVRLRRVVLFFFHIPWTLKISVVNKEKNHKFLQVQHSIQFFVCRNDCVKYCPYISTEFDAFMGLTDEFLCHNCFLSQFCSVYLPDYFVLLYFPSYFMISES